MEFAVFDLDKSYDPSSVDSKWYKFWEENGFFSGNANSDKPPYCIMIPPPNITGVLHMGHALTNTIQDVLTRWKRMSGFEAIWVPGVDHAGIATQTVVEKKLIAETGKRRKDFPREEFLKHIWNWKEQHEDIITSQLKKLGCSCDWPRSRFTMDKECNFAVRTIFKKMFDEGLIYRGDYLVNWDPVTQTALADDEVEHEERQSSLWYFKYPYKDGSGHATIATTRPETMLGDTAVAVSPRDERYKDMIGKTIILPIVGREIPIIADHYVDPEFGSGMVKITPAHDPNDYTIGINHDLEFVNIMTPDGKINENGGEFQGMTMLEARKAVVQKFKEQNLLADIKPHTLRVGLSYRSKAIIEPYMSKQWFVKMDGFAEKLKKAVNEKSVALIPKNWENTYFHWIDNLRDWCISRQLWWGHRIPIWYNKEDPEKIICYDGEGQPPEVEQNPDQWYQDEDVLDTWFSSGLWPFSTLGWPNKTPDLEKFYPNAVLVTGHDILFFWVARMMFMGEYALGEFPFPEVVLHGLIYGKSYWRDNTDGGITYVSGDERRTYDLEEKKIPSDVHSKWEKMSKSKGNIINPLEVIKEYGTDAIRIALCVSGPQSREIDLDRRRFEEFKNFINKIWNGARFVFMNLKGITSEQLSEGIDEKLLKLEDRWILSMLNTTIKEVNKALSEYALDQAALKAYNFFWKEFCAYYIEISKPVLFGDSPEKLNKQKILVTVMTNVIRLLHPIAPFITEELFQLLKKCFPNLSPSESDPYTADTIEALLSPACIVAKYPSVIREDDINEQINESFKLIENIVYTIRNIRGEMKLPPSTKTDVLIMGPADEMKMVQDNAKIITALVKIKELQFVKNIPEDGFGATGIASKLKMFIPLPAELQEQEITRLKKEKEKLEVQTTKIQQQLANKNFVERAPAHLVDKQKQALENIQNQLKTIEQKLK
jgi:valyl-tRNA synthetase